jgi:hypothetical protein
VTNDGPDAVSGCPVRMSGRIVLSSIPRFYRVLSFRSLIWVRKLSPADQLVRYAAHPRGPHGTRTPTANDTASWDLSLAKSAR